VANASAVSSVFSSFRGKSSASAFLPLRGLSVFAVKMLCFF
jgi:hypothetical protein